MSEYSDNDKIFLYGLKIENIIEYIESKVLDAFFGYKHDVLDSIDNLLNNLINWVWRLKQEIKDASFLSSSLSVTIINIIDRIDEGVRNLKVSIEEQKLEASNKELEKILKAIRDFYKLRKA